MPKKRTYQDQKKAIQKYQRSEKGKIARRKASAKRYKKLCDAQKQLTELKELISNKQ